MTGTSWVGCSWVGAFFFFFFLKLRCGYIYGVRSIQVRMDRVRCICTEHMYGVCMYGSLEAVY